jgi:hypothetical protein
MGFASCSEVVGCFEQRRSSVTDLVNQAARRISLRVRASWHLA